MKEEDYIRVLFPNYFKKIGLGIIVFTVLATIISGMFHFSIFAPENFAFREGFYCLLVIGMFVYAFSKEKIEDERLSAIRNRVMTYTFYVGVSVTLTVTILNIFLKSNPNDPGNYKAIDLIFLMFCFYIFLFFVEKRK